MKTETEIKKEFENVTGLNEAKKIFKKLAKELHPDIGGSEEEFKILNASNKDNYLRSIQNGAILISRLSEYSAIFLAHKFRRFNLKLQTGLIFAQYL